MTGGGAGWIEVWVRNQGAACTTAAALAALAALGARDLPPLGPATLRLGARVEYGAPPLLDYVSLPGRRAPLDRRLEQLGLEAGVRIQSHSTAVPPWWRPSLSRREVVLAHLAWGQEAPGRWGAWGWNPLRPSTYSTGGHTVVVTAVEGRSWLVLDPNLEGVQRWPRPGIPTAITRLSPS